MDQIFTTRGYVDKDLIEIRERVTFEDETIKWVSMDKHLKSTGEFVGNDLVGYPKTGFSMQSGLDQGSIS